MKTSGASSIRRSSRRPGASAQNTSHRRLLAGICLTAICAVLISSSITPAGAGISEAKKLLQDKKYSEVDKALGKELRGKSPSAEALQISLDAAMASGKFVTAQRRVTTLLKTRGNDLELVFKGAEIAQLACQDSLALTRYLDYAQRQNTKSDKLRYALGYVAANGKFPQQYKKYVRLFGKDEIAWSMGTDLLGRLITDGEINPTFDLAQTLLENFRHPRQVYEVHRRLQYAAENNRLGSDVQNAYVLPIKVIAQSIPSNYEPYSRLLARAAGKISKDDLLGIVFDHQTLAKKPLPGSVFGFYREIRNLGSEEKKLTAARKFLALEPVYRKSTNPREYADYMGFFVDYMDVFKIKDKELLTESAAEGMIKSAVAMAKKSPHRELTRRINDIADRYVDSKRREEIKNKHAAQSSPKALQYLLPKIKGPSDPNRAKLIAEGKGKIAKFLSKASYTQKVDVQSILMRWYKSIGDKAALIAAARDYMDLRPVSFSEHTIRVNILDNKLLSTAEKVALVRTQLERAGSGQNNHSMAQLIKQIRGRVKKVPEYKTLVDLFKARKTGKDVLSTYAVLTSSTNNKRQLARGGKLASEFLSKYKRPLPLGPKGCKNRDDALALKVMYNIYNGTRSGQVRSDIAKLWMARAATPGYMLPTLARSLTADEITKAMSRIGGAIPSGDPVWAKLVDIPYHGPGKTPPLAKFYNKMGWDNALRHVAVQMGYPHANRQGPWKSSPDVAAAAVAKLVASGGFKSTDASVLGYVIESLASGKEKIAEGTLAALWGNYLSVSDRSDWRRDLHAHCSVLRILGRSGKAKALAANVNSLVAGLGRLGAVTRAKRLEYVCYVLGIGSENGLKTAGAYALVAEKLADVYTRMSDSDWVLHNVSSRFVEDMSLLFKRSQSHRKSYSADGRLFKAADKINPILIARFARGSRPVSPSALGKLATQVRIDLEAAITASKWERATRLGALYFRALPQVRTDWDSAYHEDIVKLAKTLTETKAWEVLYTTLERMRQARPRESVMKALARYRTRAANNITGLMAVSRGDKTYQLHLAARVLSLGDEGRAWQLTRTRTKLLLETWTSFEPRYVAWCIEQMRKNKMLTEALELAFTVLLRESDLEAEIAAEVLLTRGDIYRDKKNFDVARIEYRALKDNTRYRRTAAGSRATYHLVNLMIETGQYTTAKRLVERLIDSVDLTVKAEGYYLMAKLAFEQKDYETASENIDKVRLCVNDHVEAAFLDGQLKLELPGGMINPEVEVGTAATRRILIPGEELALKLQDANLSIARDQKTIPILVRSTSGKDEERVDLLSLAGGKNLFTGMLRTVLGTAKPGNGVLEVTGADRVSYAIAPDFQRKNKIDYPPKYLDIRTTGQLVASAGKILTPEEAEKRRLEAGLTKAKDPLTIAAWKRSSGNMVRPGNDIYLQVYDIDQDVTNGADKVTVKLTTTNGDVIEAVELTENAPHSGAFRGTVKTGIPLPKATASDTFEGKKPSALINSTIPGNWSSLADGLKPKSVGVDMMGSYLMKTITAELPDAGAAKSVKLLARLATDFQVIASYPVLGTQKGLRAEYFTDAEMTKPAGEKTVTTLTSKVEKGIAAVRYSGVFVAKASGEHTFGVNTDGVVTLTVGGKEIITTKGKNSSGKTPITVDDSLIAGKGEIPFVLVYIPSDKQSNLSVTVAGTPLDLTTMYPGGQAQRRDELGVQYAGVTDGKVEGADATTIAEHFAQRGGKGTIYRPAASYTAPEAEWGILQMSGHFYVPKARYMTLKLTGKSFENPESWAGLFIDGEIVLRRQDRKNRDGTPQVVPAVTVKLTKGVHKLSVALCGRKACDIAVTCQNDTDDFVPLSPAWFSADHHAELIAATSPAGHIGVKGNRLICQLSTPQRLRAVQWVFNDYEGSSLSVKKLGITGADGKVLIPVKRDFTSATTNNILEIAPGDKVTALYVDVKRPEGGSPNRRASLSTGYYNGSIVIANEMVTDTGGGMKTTYFPAKRCGVGDALAILVNEADNDTTTKRDVMKVRVETSSGQSIELDALETEGQVVTDPTGKEIETHHTGEFLALLRLGKKTAKGTIKVEPGDLITVSYMDSENSNPGVAFRRKYELFEGGDPLVEKINFERYTSSLVRIEVKNDPDSILKGRKENEAPKFAYEHMLSRTDSPRVGAEPDALPVTSIRGPLQFTIMYPAMAKNTASTIDAIVWAESEMHAAKSAKREMKKLAVKVPCGTGGLEDGIFTGVVALQIGIPGQDAELTDDPALAILDTRTGKGRETQKKTEDVLVVVPGDTLWVKYKDPATEKEITGRITLLSEGGLELIDAKMNLEREKVRLGETFYLRVTDSDRDTTPERDTVTVKATSRCGDKVDLKLTETMGRSGIFTGRIEPQFLGDKVDGKLPTPNKVDNNLSAFFGDEIRFEYIDPLGVNSAVPVTHVRAGLIHLGSDAGTDLFSKRFRDSEMAVKTSFLMAEALFELAKQKRTLKKEYEADEFIQKGKALLESTIRDYPDTKLKVQARFLLANLAQELEKRDEAIAKYSQVIAMAPQSDYAARAQYKTAQCYEEMNNAEQACEEYVKVTYVYSSSPLAPTARIRMGTYYMQLGQKLKTDETQLADAMKNFRIASRIFAKFTERHSGHPKAARALFLSGQCAMELKDFREAVATLQKVVEDFPTNKSVRAEAMYWCGDSMYNIRDYKGAYKMWTELIWAYPEVQRAKEARGRLASDNRMMKIAEEM
ncbi:MAG: tetratricopeptide repeat protein [Phycisphaerae bacterium]|jgi:TolA-binding protein|nr:tetratricopeptide repeat protein [Phycisphaerae bacterium]